MSSSSFENFRRIDPKSGLFKACFNYTGTLFRIFHFLNSIQFQNEKKLRNEKRTQITFRNFNVLFHLKCQNSFKNVTRKVIDSTATYSSDNGQYKVECNMLYHVAIQWVNISAKISSIRNDAATIFTIDTEMSATLCSAGTDMHAFFFICPLKSVSEVVLHSFRWHY